MTPAHYIWELLITGVAVPVAVIFATLAMRRNRKGPVPSWADVAGVAVAFDIGMLVLTTDGQRVFLNSHIQEIAGTVLAGLLALALLAWIVLISWIEAANEQNFNFASNKYVIGWKRALHWTVDKIAVIFVFACHMAPFIAPERLQI